MMKTTPSEIWEPHLQPTSAMDKLVVKTGLCEVCDMKEVGSYEAKTHLAELLDDVANGETIVVTKRGKPVAKIVPYQAENMSVDDISQQFERLRKSIPAAGPSIRDMIEEGRRF